QKVREAAARMERHPHLAVLAADLRSFADGSVKIQQEAARVATLAVQSGETGAFDQQGLQNLCGDIVDSDNAAGTLLNQIAGMIKPDPRGVRDLKRDRDPDDAHERALLEEARSALTESQNGMKQLEAALSKVFPCGTPVIAA